MVNELAVRQLNPGQRPMEAWRGEMRTQLHAIARECPRDLALDHEHALVRVAGVMLAGAGVPLARRALIRGLLSDGHSTWDVERALRCTPGEIERAQGALPIHEPGVQKRRELLARLLPIPGDQLEESRSMSNADRRQGNLVRGSRGWRTPEGSPNETTTPRHP
jgi:hypothetical protein